MSPHLSTRRTFIWTAGAAVSGPIAAVAAALPAGAVTGGGDPLDDPAMLVEVNAIRELTLRFATYLDAGAHQAVAALFVEPADAVVPADICGVSADRFGELDAIEIGAGRRTATARLHCIVETASEIGPSCPLVDMARQQGGGMIRRRERGVFEHVYVKRDGAWKIQRSAYCPAGPV